ncbi:hypothetical protein CTAYLR_009198 [Chrysophaeum taylorii]|uniref:ZC3H15/TMA46 family C-terminal domain-containing protein n=1 Tax=Chrysophaeum taylorii TaxID=2483200 RepID=A0AAD7XQS9_9STRA|nr:hypothetical protein CTAYLR_009198 [Chrysophaeum taylorii]
MPPNKGGAKQKAQARRAQEKAKDKVAEDKTFGLKNKNKSKVVQKYVANVQKNLKGADPAKEKAREEKKQLKIMRIQQEQELKALFSEALSINVKKSDLRKKKSESAQATAPTTTSSSASKPSDHYDDAWAEAELEKADVQETLLEHRIEAQREAMRKEGKVGTPVTPETFAEWKKRKAERLRREKEAALKAEQLKKKGGKGLSVLSGKDLFALDASLFVDDDDAQIQDDYERRDDPPPPETPLPVGDESLYLDGGDAELDDLDDLDDDDPS